MAIRAIDMTQPRFVQLLANLRSFGFDLAVGDFVAFLNEHDEDRQAWIESAPTMDVLDWMAEELRRGQ